MIERIAIKNVRGIREGSLDGFKAINITIGPNGSGKSSILDALLIGAHPLTGDAIGRALTRRSLATTSSRDFFSVGQTQANIELAGAQLSRKLELTWQETLEPQLFDLMQQVRDVEPFQQITTTVSNDGNDGVSHHYTGFDSRNHYRFHYEGEKQTGIGTRILDPTLPLRLDVLYSDLVREGKRRELKNLLQQVIPYMVDLELLQNWGDKPALYIVDKQDQAIPLTLAGDGIVSFARLGFALLSRNEPLVLIEEPETHQHPGCLRHTARAILSGADKDRQIVLTTHSLDLIDYLIAEADAQQLDTIRLFKVALQDGGLKSSVFAGPEVGEIRESMELDLR